MPLSWPICGDTATALARARASGLTINQGEFTYDALEPTLLLSIIQAAIDEVKDSDLYDQVKDREDSEREILSKASERWLDVTSFLEATSL